MTATLVTRVLTGLLFTVTGLNVMPAPDPSTVAYRDRFRPMLQARWAYRARNVASSACTS
ncbi:hypothetical protein ACSHWB_27525 [Lentzea sp. HUAS TT2]|uniref:hypothetical protein n=1 Tax=Lentzea sp. HUAS TT2 TaxID=3447454 RepID=UPI003F6EADEE